MNVRIPDKLPAGNSLTHKMGAFARGRLLAIAALIVVRIRPSPGDWRAIRRSASSPRVRSTQLDQLLIEAVARRCVNVALSNQGLAGPFAQRLVDIAKLEGYELPHKAALNMVQAAGNNLGMAIEALGGFLADRRAAQA